jgi:hypothetical protein
VTQRLISTAVQIKAAPTEQDRLNGILAGASLVVAQPTETEVRDAMGRLIRGLEEMRLARGYSEWTVQDGSFAPNVVVTAEGEVVLRGGIIIERPD